MRNASWPTIATLSCFVLLSSEPAFADGEILITQAKATAGGVTAGDAPGFPVTLSKAGLYKLASSLVVPAGKNGIQISSSYVTVDLNGFVMQGGDSAANGIVGSDYQAITIRNGTIARFKYFGIRSSGDYSIVEGMRVVRNAGAGVVLTSNNVNGMHARVLNSTISNNGGDGVNCGEDCSVFDSDVSNNGFYGFEGSGHLLGNNVSNNANEGIYAVGQVGFGNNTLNYNNGGGSQISSNVYPLQPNYCNPVAC